MTNNQYYLEAQQRVEKYQHQLQELVQKDFFQISLLQEKNYLMR